MIICVGRTDDCLHTGFEKTSSFPGRQRSDVTFFVYNPPDFLILGRLDSQGDGLHYE